MTKKRLISAILAGIMTLSAVSSLASCSKKEQEPEKTKRTNVYSAEELPIPSGIDYINDLSVSGNNVYLTYYKQYTITYNELGEEVERREGYYWEDNLCTDVIVDMPVVEYVGAEVVEVVEEPEAEESGAESTDDTESSSETDEKAVTGSSSVASEDEGQSGSLPEGWYYGYEGVNMMAVISIETKEMHEFVLNVPDEYGYSTSTMIDNNGNFVQLTQKWVYNEDYTESSVEYYYITIDTTNGEMISAVNFNDVLESTGMDLSSTYINRCAIDSAGSLYIVLDSSVVIIDSEMNYKSTVELGEGWVNAIHAVNDKIMIVFNPDSSSTRQIYMIENGESTKIESAVLTEAFKSYPSIVGASENKLYYSTTNGIIAYDFTTDTAAEILNYINSDIDTSSGYNIKAIGNDQFINSQTEWLDDGSITTVTILTKVPDDQLQDEIILTLGCTYLDYYINKAIIAYNKQNTGIRISVKSYDEYNNQDNNWTGAVTQLNNDITTGNVPDILLLSTELPIESYFQKGIFTDLNQYIDDEEIGIDRSKYLENIFNASESNGKMQSIIINFTLNTLLAKSKFVGTESGWTFDEMMNCIDTMPEGMQAFFGYSRDQVIDTFFNNSMNSFVNWETGETIFESEGFIKFIEYLKTLPEKGYWEDYYREDYVYDEETDMQMNQNYELRYYNDTALFNFNYVGNFSSSLRYAMNSFASNEVTAIGYPTNDAESNGAIITPTVELAISASSDAKKQAWDVLKYLLNSDALTNVTWQFTSNIENLEKNKNSALEDSYYYEITDDDLEWYREMNYSEDYIEYLRQSNQPLSESMLEMTMEIIKGATEVQRQDSSLLEIIKEELSGFFAGTKSAEETAKVINSRAKIYISENS